MPSILPSFIQPARVEPPPAPAPGREPIAADQAFPTALRRAERREPAEATSDRPSDQAVSAEPKRTEAQPERTRRKEREAGEPVAAPVQDADTRSEIKSPEHTESADTAADATEPIATEPDAGDAVVELAPAGEPTAQSAESAQAKGDATAQPAHDASRIQQGPSQPQAALTPEPEASQEGSADAAGPKSVAIRKGADTEPVAHDAQPARSTTEVDSSADQAQAAAKPVETTRSPAATVEVKDRQDQTSADSSAEAPVESQAGPERQSVKRRRGERTDVVHERPEAAGDRAEPRQKAVFTVEQTPAAPIDAPKDSAPRPTTSELRAEGHRPASGVESAVARADAGAGTDDRAGADTENGRERGTAGGESVRTAPAPSAAPEADGPRFTLGGAESAQKPGPAAQGQQQPAEQAKADVFAASVSRGLAAAVNQRGGSVTMRLQPDSLGSMRIQMTIDRGVVHARFEVTTGEARDLLNQHMETLRSSLEARGLSVDRLQVQVTSGGQGGQGPQTGTHQQSSAGQEAQRGWQDAADGRSRGGHAGRDAPDQHSGGGRDQGRWNRSEHGAWTSADDAGGARAFRVRVDAVG